LIHPESQCSLLEILPGILGRMREMNADRKANLKIAIQGITNFHQRVNEQVRVHAEQIKTN
jgi:hypothetical protein